MTLLAPAEIGLNGDKLLDLSLVIGVMKSYISVTMLTLNSY